MLVVSGWFQQLTVATLLLCDSLLSNTLEIWRWFATTEFVASLADENVLGGGYRPAVSFVIVAH